MSAPGDAARTDQGSDQGPGPGSETDRIRAIYAARDRAAGGSSAFAEAGRMLADERRERMRELLGREFEGQVPAILDVGCGGGGDLRWWADAGWPSSHLAGVDLVPDRVERARAACPQVDIRLTDGAMLPFGDDTFAVATAATVFSSILDAGARRRLFAEMERVVRPPGLVVIYDFRIRKPTNRDVEAMTRRRLAELGRPPDGTLAVSPLIYALAAALRIHRSFVPLAFRVAPRTHLLAYWRVT